MKIRSQAGQTGMMHFDATLGYIKLVNIILKRAVFFPMALSWVLIGCFFQADHARHGYLLSTETPPLQANKDKQKSSKEEKPPRWTDGPERLVEP